MATAGRIRHKYREDRSPEENIALALYAIANELSDLGLAGANTPMGAVEMLAHEVKQGTERLADAVEGLGWSLPEGEYDFSAEADEILEARQAAVAQEDDNAS